MTFEYNAADPGGDYWQRAYEAAKARAERAEAALAARTEALTFEQVRDGIIGRMSGHTISAQDGPAWRNFMGLLQQVKKSECAFAVSPLAASTVPSAAHGGEESK